MKPAALFILFLIASAAPSGAATDFDHNGAEDRIVTREGKPHIETFDAKSNTWQNAGFQLPAEITTSESLQFIDLNGDSFDDLLFSDKANFHIALWSTQIKPALGWTKGWSQLVRSGERTGAENEPPPLSGAKLSIKDGDLLVSRPGQKEIRLPLTSLLAFDIPRRFPPKKPSNRSNFRRPSGSKSPPPNPRSSIPPPSNGGPTAASGSSRCATTPRVSTARANPVAW